ncbi:RNA polymerase sigma factor [Solitalea koreensis]|uniref:RNA polymerase sigma-70 factor, ECF subfamily n=1 Tax=Solitalea koreensis TaxID=543615 RepID=A0A521CAH4_9SPHI|nr:RNA polymerase sigma-70 factor [Solitalea koreensis]SMO56398.1 RNA polymerase sigma-70 factor, ECF subfamily [Solitalea koreensis]
MSKYSDIELFELIKQGDKRAFGELYERHWERLFVLACNKLPSKDDAVDLLQDLFFLFWEKRGEIHISESVASYLNVMLKHRMFNFYKHSQVKQKHTDHIKATQDDSDQSTINQLNFNELNRSLTLEINNMPGKMREVFLLSREERLSVNEIASRLSISEQTVKNQVSNAIKRLRAKLGNKKSGK